MNDGLEQFEPLVKAQMEAGKILSRQVEPETVREAFLWREIHQVTPIATNKIYGNQYEVAESLIGRSVEVRYNPYNLKHMLIYSEEEFCCEAKPYMPGSLLSRQFNKEYFSEPLHFLPNNICRIISATIRLYTTTNLEFVCFSAHFPNNIKRIRLRLNLIKSLPFRFRVYLFSHAALYVAAICSSYDKPTNLAYKWFYLRQSDSKLERLRS